MDLIVLGLGWAAAGFNIYRTFEVKKLLRKTLEMQMSHSNFDDLVFSEGAFKNISAIAVFCVWVKVGEFFQLHLGV